MTSTLFSTLPLSAEMLQNLDSLGYHQMTPIQAKSLPSILKNRDLLAKAKTGSGKTAAFGIGLLSKIDPQVLEPQACVICPTRELADQVCQEIRRLARLTPNIRVLSLCGGKPLRTQSESLKNGAHIVVGTPGRLQDHINKKTLQLDRIQTLVLDEADRMLDMGFIDAIKTMIKAFPQSRQTLLFSATYPSAIREISQSLQNKPVEIKFDTEDDTPQITQKAVQVRSHEKLDQLIALLIQQKATAAIIFCNMKTGCDDIAHQLRQKGLHALALHGDLEQKERNEVLLQFSHQSCTLLVATDVAARGIDIKDLPLVINFDLPSTPEMYVHRIGRTGRNGKTGVAISFFTQADIYKLVAIEDFTATEIERMNMPVNKKTTSAIPVPLMQTFCINAGKKDKIRPGDILGALTGEGGFTGDQIGKIDIFEFYTYIAVNRAIASQVLRYLQNGKVKGRSFKTRTLDNNIFSGKTHEI